MPVLYEACKYIGVKPDLYDPIEEQVKERIYNPVDEEAGRMENLKAEAYALRKNVLNTDSITPKQAISAAI